MIGGDIISNIAGEASVIKTKQQIEDSKGKITASISGGSDSDIMLDIIERAKKLANKDVDIEYVWFNTGLEYEATKRHLEYLRERYQIQINEHRAKRPVPISCKIYGQPFLSKMVSMYISRLQKHGFDWSDGQYDDLVKKYPKCQSALKWWCNAWGEGSRFNISRCYGLKEFIIEHPPWFKISDKCCEYAKKAVAYEIENNSGCALSMVGVRKSEGGIRSVRYSSCFTPRGKHAASYRPIFWMTDDDKREYEIENHIIHSDCYLIYGLKRTGCACCPFGSKFEDELIIAKTYEPKLYEAVQNIFGDSYRYTRMYRDFKGELRARNK